MRLVSPEDVVKEKVCIPSTLYSRRTAVGRSCRCNLSRVLFQLTARAPRSHVDPPDFGIEHQCDWWVRGMLAPLIKHYPPAKCGWITDDPFKEPIPLSLQAHTITFHTANDD